MENMEEIKQAHQAEDDLISAISAISISEYTRLQDFISLTQQLKAKQDAIDIMASDTTPAAIGASYVADTLEPNSQGDLVTLVAKTPGEQLIIDNIYKRLNIPCEKVVYSLFKNAIAICEFAHEGDLTDKAKRGPSDERPATESVTEKSATEDILVKINKSKILPKIKMISDTTRVFPILQYESVVGFIEITMDDYSAFDFSRDVISYKDVIIHSAEDFSYVKFGFRTESKPLQLKVKMENGEIVEYDIDQGKSLLETAYPAWQTLSIMKDAVNLARLSYSASSVVVQTEVGNMTEPQIELARNKLKDLFENRLAIGKNGVKSYLQPQIKPNYIYCFTNNGKGAITTSTIGGEYNPGVLTDLKYFEDEFFGGMGAVKQHYARTEDGAGLDGGSAVEEYEKRYRSYVSQFKRLLGEFIKNCINRVLLSRNLIGLYNNFEVIVNKSYEEEDLQVVNHQQTKLSFLQSAIEFMEIEDPDKVKELKLQVLRSVITDKSLIEAFSSAVMSKDKSEGDDIDNQENESLDGDNSEFEFTGSSGGGSSSGDILDQINSIGTGDEQIPDSSLDEPEMSGGEIDEGTEGELPPVDEILPESQIDVE